LRECIERGKNASEKNYRGQLCRVHGK
jgi:hypothetical protein